MSKFLAKIRAQVVAHPTAVAAFGLFGRAVYQVSVGDQGGAVHSAMEALAFLGIHLTVSPTY